MAAHLRHPELSEGSAFALPSRRSRSTARSRSFASLRMTAAVEGARAEEGYVLLGVIFFVALILLSLAIAAPKVAAAIQRDRELELVNRGEQYKRAIKLYYKKFGAYPSTMEQLEKTNNIRFLRKRYVDPLTGKDDWKLIHMGEAHIRPLGFFGKPLTATTTSGATGLNGGASSTLGQGSQTGISSSFGGTSSSFGSTNTGATGGSSTLGGAPASGGGGGLYAGVDNTGTDTGSGSTGSGTGTSTSSSSSSTGFGGGTSQTLGGAPIVGVVIKSEKTSILEYKLQKKYKDWEFVYDPVAEQAAAAGSLLGGVVEFEWVVRNIERDRWDEWNHRAQRGYEWARREQWPRRRHGSEWREREQRYRYRWNDYTAVDQQQILRFAQENTALQAWNAWIENETPRGCAGRFCCGC